MNNIDKYITQFPIDVQEKLQRIRQVVQEAAPGAIEKISYQMPTFYLFGNLVHFAAFKNHIGFYPTPSGITSFCMYKIVRFSQYDKAGDDDELRYQVEAALQ